MDLAALTARLNSFAGFSLTPEEAADLINEARLDLARRSRYPRKLVVLPDRGWPQDFLLGVRVVVDGRDFQPSDHSTAVKLESGALRLATHGVWYDHLDQNGDRFLGLYPESVGAEVKLEYVFAPVPLVGTTDVPSELPEVFHPRLLHFVAAAYYPTVEDNPELGQWHAEKAEQTIHDLAVYEGQRSAGTGVFNIGILGVNQ